MHDGFWEMRDGTEIAIRDMDDSHLLNAIKMLERKDDTPLAVCEEDVDSYDVSADPTYHALCAEADRRKLNY